MKTAGAYYMYVQYICTHEQAICNHGELCRNLDHFSAVSLDLVSFDVCMLCYVCYSRCSLIAIPPVQVATVHWLSDGSLE